MSSPFGWLAANEASAAMARHNCMRLDGGTRATLSGGRLNISPDNIQHTHAHGERANERTRIGSSRRRIIQQISALYTASSRWKLRNEGGTYLERTTHANERKAISETCLHILL